MVGGSWGQEERELSLNPFLEGQYFDVSLATCLSDCFVYVCPSACLCLSLCLPVCVCPSACLSVSVLLPACLPVSLPACVCLLACLSAYLPACLCLSDVCLTVSLSVSHTSSCLPQMSIRCGNQRYKVFVNGQHMCDFFHRYQAFNQVDTLEIIGDVQISYVHF